MSFLLGACAAVYGLVLGALFVYGLNCHLLVLLSRRARPEPPDGDAAPRDGAWPRVTVQLPVYNEPQVVERLIRAVARLRYPRPLEIQLLDDSTDETPAIAARTIASLGASLGPDAPAIVHLRRTARRGYKAGALADGLRRATGDAIAIFDADFVPAPDFLLRTVPSLMEPGVAAVQARWGHLNRDEGPLTRAQALAIDGHFGVEQPARATAGFVAAFNGSAGVWRREAIVAAGGWSPDTLTEDLDLSVRARLAGLRIRYLQQVVVPAELPGGLGALKAQQRRWAQGSIENAIKHGRALLRAPLPAAARLEALLHLTHYLVHPLILLSVLLVLPLDLLVREGGDRPGLATLALPLLLASGGPTAMYLVAQRRLGERGWLRWVRDLPWLLLLGTGLSLSNTVGVARALARRKGRFVRTPKGHGGLLPGGSALALAELLSGAACLALGADLTGRGLASFAPFLFLDGAGLIWVGGGTIVERLGSLASAAARTAPAPPARPAHPAPPAPEDAA